MIRVDNTGKAGYRGELFSSDPLKVEKGWCHFSREGEKDFINSITAYEPIESGIRFETSTFRGNTAQITVRFVNDTVFRFTMFPHGVDRCGNAVFGFPAEGRVKVSEDADFIIAETGRVTLRFRKMPWEMTVALDGEALTCEQIRDHNVDQKYKAVPVGFTVGEDGRILSAHETMYMYTDEAFYGFGEKFTSFNKRGQKITVWQRDAQSTNSDVSYKGMPYFMSTAGYALFLNTYTRTHFNMGATSFVSYTMETEDPYLDYYMLCNRDYKGLIQDYTALSGRSEMIPRWAFGFWMSKMVYGSREEVETIVSKMDEFGMSADVIHIDGYVWNDLSSIEPLCFGGTRFPEPEEMIARLREKGIHVSLWMYPYIDSTDRNGQPSPLLKEMEKRGYLVKWPDGSVCTFPIGEGDVAGAKVAAYDFTNPSAAAFIKERIKRLMHMGVGVMKTDFSEELPETAVFYDGTTGLQSHNKYTLLYAKTIYEACREAKEEMGERGMLWGRSGYLGSQNYPANWAGDSSAAQNNQAALLSAGLGMGISGVSFWGFDIGGFYNCDYEGNRTMPGDEEYIRSVQLGMLSPLSRAHGQATSREPWMYSERAQKAFLKINKLRYRLLPYIYSTAWETHNTGLPMMRAMVLEFPEDRTTWPIGSQYMLGEALLAAPVFDQQNHDVYLPAGSWIDMESGHRVAGGRWVRMEKRFDVIPLFLRENRALYVLRRAPMHIADRNFEDVEIVMNITDRIAQKYFDDGVDGSLSALLEGERIEIKTDGIPAVSWRVFTDREIRCAVVNGTERSVAREGEAFLIK